MAATHDAGVVHRDLSPEHLIERLPRRIGSRFVFWTSDLEGERRPERPDQTKMIMGTPHYMSPEQALGHTKQTDARATIRAGRHHCTSC